MFSICYVKVIARKFVSFSDVVKGIQLCSKAHADEPRFQVYLSSFFSHVKAIVPKSTNARNRLKKALVISLTARITCFCRTMQL